MSRPDGNEISPTIHTQYALHPLFSSTTLCSPPPTINFRLKIAFVWCSERFYMRNKWLMHNALQSGFGRLYPSPHHLSAWSTLFPTPPHWPFLPRRITTPMSGRISVAGSALHPYRHCATTDHDRLQFCSANLHIFLHNLADRPHRWRILMVGDSVV